MLHLERFTEGMDEADRIVPRNMTDKPNEDQKSLTTTAQCLMVSEHFELLYTSSAALPKCGVPTLRYPEVPVELIRR